MSWFAWNICTQDMKRKKNFQTMVRTLKMDNTSLLGKNRQEAFLVAFFKAMIFPRIDKKNQYSSIENSHCYGEENEIHYLDNEVD